MAKSKRGRPCWYELETADLGGAAAFYGHVLGWTVSGAEVAGFDYRLATFGGENVAGIMAATAGTGPLWSVYFSVADCDKSAKSIAKAGGVVHHAPTDIPDIGRFAVVADPQGASFGILQPLDGAGTTFAGMQPGRGCWHELMTSDPEAALAFYGKHLGWKPGSKMDMGPMGHYHLFQHGKADIGGIMKQAPGMPGPDRPYWLPYFGTDSVDAAMARTMAAGGTVLHGPHEVPGGAFIMVGRDPQGAVFALVGPK